VKQATLSLPTPQALGGLTSGEGRKSAHLSSLVALKKYGENSTFLALDFISLSSYASESEPFKYIFIISSSFV
jgi:hypothetical protein